MMIETDALGAPVFVDQLDEDWLLELASHAEVESRRAERSKLRYAYQWCVLHPARTVEEAATWGDVGGRERDCDLAVGGEGTPGVAAFAAEPLAAALGISTRAGMRLMSDALDLVHRLPAHWAKVEALEVAPWRARRVAQATSGLSRQAAAYVDSELAPILDSCGPTRIDRVVEEARARFDAAEQAEAEEAEKAGWGVQLAHGPSGRFLGTSWLQITGDTPTLTRLHDLITTIAHQLLDPTDLGCPSLEQRQVAAVAEIVDRATTTTTTTAATSDPHGSASAPAGSAGHTRARSDGRSSRSGWRFYLHLDGQALADETVHVGHAERLGPVTTELIKQWLAGASVSVQPVLRTDRRDAVDAHDPPAWMRDLVILRDRTCVHPYCDRDSRDCDLDHIDEYVDPGNGGPPGQTRPDNLAPLCRRHHRAKTFGGWRYHRNPDGTYTWRSPHGHRYTVAPDGTVTVD